MESSDLQVMPVPPSLMKSLMAGFDAISNHFGLILFSVGLDLFLWFGPHLRLLELVRKITEQMTTMPGTQGVELIETLEAAAADYNLASVLRTFPVGIPSLMANRLPTQIPLGQPSVLEIGSPEMAFGLWLMIALVGLAAGTLYFAVVSQAALADGVDWRRAFRMWPWACLQVCLLTIVWLALFFAALIPFSCLFSLLFGSLGNVGLVVAVLFGGLLVWLLVPLAFSPHGIFVYNRGMWKSLTNSIRLIRLTLPRTGVLLLIILILSEGLDVLWSVPAETSWWTLVGVIGHAFVTTSLLAASFVYYRDAGHWTQQVMEKSKLNLT